MSFVTLVFVFILNGSTYEAEMNFLTMESCLQVGQEMQASELDIMPAGCFQDEARREQIRGRKA